MKNKFPIALFTSALALVALVTLSSCNNTKVQDVWTAPDLTGIEFKRIMVIAATPDGTNRRVAEDAMATAMPKVRVLPSYAWFTDPKVMQDVDQVTKIIKDANVDGIVVMRLLSDKDRISVTQTSSYPMGGMGYGGYPRGYGSFGGYYGGYGMHSYGYGYNDTTVTTDRVVQIETNIYEAKTEKLIWSGVTESVSPDNVGKLINDTVKSLRAHLIKQGLIPKAAN